MTDPLDTIREAVAKLEAQAGRTPTAFNWTPEMEAIWPRDMRPTMSGLLAIWEAMHGAAVYGDQPEADEDGWIPWHVGDEDPGDVEFVCADGYSSTGHIPNGWMDGTGNPGDQIVKWRPFK